MHSKDYVPLCSYPSVKFLSVGVQKVAKETDRPSKLGVGRRSTSFPASFQVLAAFFLTKAYTEPKLERHDRQHYDCGSLLLTRTEHFCTQLTCNTFFLMRAYWTQLSLCRPLAKCREEADGLVTRACIAVSDS
ncbi:hypothetical protein T4B_7162 [Trichinella pseudospiralis]|uniref:Uncharacterized protein n=1 Tax=Trichinella pseudospiralis TaxID=6337 RepID=A0A0V1IFT3_TRIPS|nr:hypothetical protein T4B_7162 [Trichinella pseudospiralis]